MHDLDEMISLLDRLPPVSTLIIMSGCPDFEVNFDINYKITTTTTTSAATQLGHFTFGWDKEEVISSKKLLSGQLVTNDLMIGETRKTGKKADISWLTVTVTRCLDQSQLVGILFRLALEMHDILDH